ncbi:STRUCTURAL MAINTENANCE OF CHROMOSOMES SMC FAMILY MEMBER [Ceraceosorus bombacis]|uniref:STRUCTURAL MAINTENANCE OF CHROMOSOMES SMC FAMILY MEMBER n=1 Tax=Ceraceosorus bombacis TaxID=401625 RepID=A0A0P1BB32_9BASI|nr:STRUCTURAL MAINTENANCE OF CHROMOSOMES SMC FAMILY MEMBER [Ceraceosorus bombacis]
MPSDAPLHGNDGPTTVTPDYSMVDRNFKIMRSLSEHAINRMQDVGTKHASSSRPPPSALPSAFRSPQLSPYEPQTEQDGEEHDLWGQRTITKRTGKRPSLSLTGSEGVTGKTSRRSSMSEQDEELVQTIASQELTIEHLKAKQREAEAAQGEQKTTFVETAELKQLRATVYEQEEWFQQHRQERDDLQDKLSRTLRENSELRSAKKQLEQDLESYERYLGAGKDEIDRNHEVIARLEQKIAKNVEHEARLENEISHLEKALEREQDKFHESKKEWQKLNSSNQLKLGRFEERVQELEDEVKSKEDDMQEELDRVRAIANTVPDLQQEIAVLTKFAKGMAADEGDMTLSELRGERERSPDLESELTGAWLPFGASRGRAQGKRDSLRLSVAQSEREIAYAESGMQTHSDESEAPLYAETKTISLEARPPMVSAAVQSDLAPLAPTVVVHKVDLNELRIEAVKRLSDFWRSSNRNQTLLTVVGLAWVVHYALSESDDEWVNRTDTFMNPGAYVPAFGH